MHRNRDMGKAVNSLPPLCRKERLSYPSSRANRDCRFQSSMAHSIIAVDHDAEMARSPLHALARPSESTPPSHSRRTPTRDIRRQRLGRRGSLPHVGSPRPLDAPSSGRVRFPRTERAHLRNAKWQAGCLVFQPRCSQCIGRSHRPPLVSFVVFQSAVRAKRIRRRHKRVSQQPNSSRRTARRPSRLIQTDWPGFPSTARLYRIFSQRALLPICLRRPSDLVRGNRPSAMAASASRSANQTEHNGSSQRHRAAKRKAAAAFFKISGRKNLGTERIDLAKKMK